MIPSIEVCFVNFILFADFVLFFDKNNSAESGVVCFYSKRTFFIKYNHFESVLIGYIVSADAATCMEKY